MKRKLLYCLLSVMVLMAAHPVMALSANDSFVTWEGTGNKNTVNVIASLSNEEPIEDITTLQIEFELSGDKVQNAEFVFSGQIQKDPDITIKDAIYQEGSKRLTVYLSGTKTILSKGMKLNLGTIQVDAGSNVQIQVNEDSCMVVNRFHQKAKLSNAGAATSYELEIKGEDQTTPPDKEEQKPVKKGSSGNEITGIRGNWNSDQKGWTFKKTDGTIVKNEWAMVGDKWYFFGEDGYMKTGWIFYQNNWYFCNPAGEMKTGWIHVNDKWYYCNYKGVMKTGWIQDKSYWYYLEPSGEMKTGWLESGGKWYYMQPEGKMLTSSTTPDGYQVDRNGVRVNK